jgi:hypothetical protein
MDEKLLLVKVITLLYRESHQRNRVDTSTDLVRTALENITLPTISTADNTYVDTIRALKATALEMCNNPTDTIYDKTSLLQSLKLMCVGNDVIYNALEQGIEPDLEEKAITRTVNNIKHSVSNYFKEKKIESILNKAAHEFRLERHKIKDTNAYISNIVAQLEPLQITSTSKDLAIVSDIDIGDDSAMNAIFNDVKTSNNGVGVMRTGWQAVNDMLQGGFRRGEFIMISALQHKYKTGLTLSLFEQVAMFNKPHMLDPAKKPLLLRISFEDDLNSNMQFMYQYLKYNETDTPVNVKNVDPKVMSNYVRDTLKINGYHIKMLRVDPSQWTYKNICNKVMELEAQGYEIHMLMLDYLAMVPTTGCTVGPMGTDLQDMVRRVRNFCSPRKICCITPQQFSNEAKQLIRNGIPEDRFVKEVAGKGYFAICKSLDREIDVELNLHIFKFKGNSYLTLQLGKHRLPTIVDESKKYLLYEFPKYGMPIRHDLNRLDSSFKSLKDAVEASANSESGGDKEVFNF